jgi:hypothetical protein
VSAAAVQREKTAAWYGEVWRRSGNKLPEYASLIGMDAQKVKPAMMTMKALKAHMLTTFNVVPEGQEDD